ncbi:MAG TPA: serine/threonine-protein kinase [Kofleriaceae bacterium]|nr:serine/threonine-protein kinase [Kofleriaceae bacterium]
MARVGPIVPALAAGQILADTYELIDRIGAGGMGIVYRARDRKLGRDVAVKTLKPSSKDGDLRRLFDREARATAQLLHPNIVTLHHVGEHEGQPYLVLELLTGETLASRLARRRKLPVSDALAILDAVLAAIAFAHERGVLHRDLKPSNVFITVDERVKVLDFGVALAVDTSPGPVTRVAGTPGYMAPEQRQGEDQDVRTDVWAAALLLLECVLGRRATEAELPAALREIEAAPTVRAVLERALSPEPANRPATASELRQELAAATAPATARIGKRARRVLVGAVLATAALAAGTTYLVTRTEPATRRSITAAELNARAWHVNYGEMRLHVDDDGTFYGVYDQGNGVLVGHYANNRFTGWWCQEPSRQGPDDAGQVTLHFVRGENRILVEGLWTYGDGRAAAWQDNFYGVSLETPPSYTLERRLQHHQGCPGH